MFGARFRQEFAFAVQLPKLRMHAGPVRVTGRLLAFPAAAVKNVRDPNRFDESKAVASLPFDVTVQVPPPPVTVTGRGTFQRADGRVSVNVTLTGVQEGRRVARMQVGGGVSHTIIDGKGGQASASFQVVGQTQAPGTATVTFRNFGADVTVSAAFETKVSGERKPLDTKELTRLQTRLAERKPTQWEQLEHVAFVRRSIARVYEPEAPFDPGPWIQACDAWFDAETQVAAVAGDQNWSGWDGRPPNQVTLADKGRSARYATFYNRFATVEGALRLGMVDAPRTWLVACEAGVATALADDPERVKRELGAIAGAYIRLASVTLRATGDADAADVLVRHAQEIRRKLNGGASGPPEKTGFEIDPEYRR